MIWQDKTIRSVLIIILLLTSMRIEAVRTFLSIDITENELSTTSDQWNAQDSIPLDSVGFFDTVLLNDTIDSITAVAYSIAEKKTTTFKPNPKRASLMAAIFPGVGQIYNRQYWKLPIVYGGFFGFLYAITWNNKNYSDYSEAYFDIMADAQNDPTGANPDSWHQSWQNFTSDPAARLHNSYFQNQLKSGKDFYRRYRDLSIILSVGFYLICIADAYVDAQMFDFDISPDLSFRIMPELRPATIVSSRSFGIHVCMTF